MQQTRIGWMRNIAAVGALLVPFLFQCAGGQARVLDTLDAGLTMLEQPEAGTEQQAAVTQPDPAPEAAWTDADLEKRIRKAVQKSLDSGTAYRVILLEDWDLVRHEYSGAIIRRHLHADVGVQKGPGSCIWQTAIMRQEHLGNQKYGRLIYVGASQRRSANCADIGNS